MTDDYATPEWLHNIFKDWYDPCPLNWDGKTDGLTTSWPDRTYVNPPYSNPAPWVKKAIRESKQGKRVVMLLRVDTSTKWFAELIEAGAHIFWHNGRIFFKPNEPPSFSSMLVLL